MEFNHCFEGFDAPASDGLFDVSAPSLVSAADCFPLFSQLVLSARSSVRLYQSSFWFPGCSATAAEFNPRAALRHAAASGVACSALFDAPPSGNRSFVSSDLSPGSFVGDGFSVGLSDFSFRPRSCFLLVDDRALLFGTTWDISQLSASCHSPYIFSPARVSVARLGAWFRCAFDESIEMA